MSGRLAAALACVVLAGAVVGIGVLDHHLKQGRMDRAERSEWYCTHLHQRCGGPSSARIEHRWNRRELGYEIALGALVAAGLVLGVTALARRRAA